MFSTLNEKYQKTISDAEDEKLIMEAITGSDMDPSIEAAAEDEVDVYSVPRKDLDKLDKFADKLVSSSDYDDEDLDDLLDDGYDDAIVVAEASVTTPSGDKPGDYNSGIKSGEVNYKMTDCEDRGGVGVNSVIARNDQLSESILAINFELSDMLCEAAGEGKTGRAAAIFEKVRNALGKALDWILKTLKKLGAMVSGPFKKMWAAIVKAYKNRKKKGANTSDKEAAPAPAPNKDEEIAKARAAAEKYQQKQEEARQKMVKARREAEEEDDYLHVSIVPGIYDDPKLIDKAVSAANASKNYASGKLHSFRNSNVKSQPINSDVDKIIKLVEEVKYDSSKKKVSFDEYFNKAQMANFNNTLSSAINAFGTAVKDFKTIQSHLDALYRQFKTKGNMTMSGMDDVSSDDYAAQEKVTQAASGAYAKANSYAAQLRGVNRAISAITAATKRLESITLIHGKNLEAIQKALNLHNSAAGVEIGKRIKAKREGTYQESVNAVGNLYTRAYQFVNENCIGGFQNYFDEATGEFFFGFELEEAAGNSTTYEEFKEHLKTDGTLKVEPPKVDAHPKDDMAKRDPAQPGLTNETSLAKNTLCKAYTADQLASIPSSKMSAVRTAITDTIATKNAAIASLKESYEAHLGDSYEVRSAILEDASMIRRDLDNLHHNLALVEDMLNPESLDSLAESVFGESSNDWSYLFEDSEADLDDLDLGDDEKDSDSDKDEKDDDKDDKKSKKSEKSKKDDEECEDGECDDEDKDGDDNKNSKKSNKSESDKEDKDDDKKEDKDDEDVDESASLLAVIGDLMSALD